MPPNINGIGILQSFFFVSRWDDDVVFKNCAKDEEKDKVGLARIS